jgi:hypothetical protein
MSSENFSQDEPKGWLPYDLADNFCEECWRPKINRLFFGEMTCGDCATRHRCTKRPDLEPGQSWECPDCGSTWTAREEEETCECCGQGIGTMRKTWDSIPGDRIDTAPRYEVPVFTPLRNKFKTPPREKPFQGLPPV